ncbi:MAG: Rieske (2Fe-2S) protein [Propionicimonas sp.]
MSSQPEPLTTTTGPSTPSRRLVLTGAGGFALAACLAGCGAPTSAMTSTPAGDTTVPAADIPVGTGKVVGNYVVTQPTAGTFVAFSYLCTHQNLPVQQVLDTTIICGRHGSTYSIKDGSVLTGPATVGLTKATVTKSGDSLKIT